MLINENGCKGDLQKSEDSEEGELRRIDVLSLNL